MQLVGNANRNVGVDSWSQTAHRLYNYWFKLKIHRALGHRLFFTSSRWNISYSSSSRSVKSTKENQNNWNYTKNVILLLTFEGVWSVQSNCTRMKCYCEEWVGVWLLSTVNTTSRNMAHIYTPVPPPLPQDRVMTRSAFSLGTWYPLELQTALHSVLATLCPLSICYL